MLNFIRKLKSGNDGRNVRHAGVMVVAMAMTMLVIVVVISMTMLMIVISVTVLMVMVFMAVFMIMVSVTVLMLVNMLVQLGSSMTGLMAVLVVVISMAMLMIVVSVTVLMLVVMDIVAFFFLSVYSHGHVGSCDPTFNCGLCLNADIFKAQLIHFFQESLFVRAYFIKSCHEHISCCSHTAIKIDRLHIFPPFFRVIP